MSFAKYRDLERFHMRLAKTLFIFLSLKTHILGLIHTQFSVRHLHHMLRYVHQPWDRAWSTRESHLTDCQIKTSLRNASPYSDKLNDKHLALCRNMDLPLAYFRAVNRRRLNSQTYWNHSEFTVIPQKCV